MLNYSKFYVGFLTKRRGGRKKKGKKRDNRENGKTKKGVREGIHDVIRK